MTRRILVVGPEGSQSLEDELSVEEPLEIRVNGKPVSITMRTPGHDLELALGFLHGEGLLAPGSHGTGCASPGAAGVLARPAMHGKIDQQSNTIDVPLAGPLDTARLERHFYASSSCGVCGKSSLKALATLATPVRSDLRVSADLLRGLPAKLAAAQATFARTGSLHATGIFDERGDLVCAFEDVGRHNAVDKAIGSSLLAGRLPLDRHIMLVSGRTSFEILQKAAMAGIPIVAAISGPSTLAVDLAEAFGIALAGFLRGRKFNIYSHPERIQG